MTDPLEKHIRAGCSVASHSECIYPRCNRMLCEVQRSIRAALESYQQDQWRVLTSEVVEKAIRAGCAEFGATAEVYRIPDVIRAALASLPTAPAPEGWQLMPVEIRMNMIAALRKMPMFKRTSDNLIMHAYDALLASAPKPPVEKS